MKLILCMFVIYQERRSVNCAVWTPDGLRCMTGPRTELILYMIVVLKEQWSVNCTVESRGADVPDGVWMKLML
jgi:hypothetical protein